MSGSLNKVFLIGNCGKDPEVKVTPSGQSLTKFSIATSDSWTDAAGEKQTKTTWHNITCWGKLAEIASKFVVKGKQVLIEGKIENHEYTDPAGVKKVATDIRATTLILLGERPAAQAKDNYDDASVEY